MIKHLTFMLLLFCLPLGVGTVLAGKERSASRKHPSYHPYEEVSGGDSSHCVRELRRLLLPTEHRKLMRRSFESISILPESPHPVWQDMLSHYRTVVRNDVYAERRLQDFAQKPPLEGCLDINRLLSRYDTPQLFRYLSPLPWLESIHPTWVSEKLTRDLENIGSHFPDGVQKLSGDMINVRLPSLLTHPRVHHYSPSHVYLLKRFFRLIQEISESWNKEPSYATSLFDFLVDASVHCVDNMTFQLDRAEEEMLLHRIQKQEPRLQRENLTLWGVHKFKIYTLQTISFERALAQNVPLKETLETYLDIHRKVQRSLSLYPYYDQNFVFTAPFTIRIDHQDLIRKNIARWTTENLLTFFCSIEELDRSNRLTLYHQFYALHHDHLMDYLTTEDPQGFGASLRPFVIEDLTRLGFLKPTPAYLPLFPPVFSL